MIAVIGKEQNIKICSKCKISGPHYKNCSWCKSCQGKYKRDRITISFPHTKDYIKNCNKCKEDKLHSPRGIWCKDCWSAQRVEYVKKNYKEIKIKDIVRRKEKVEQDPLHFRKIAYKHKYNITLEDYNLMLERQNYSCAICKSTVSGGKRPNFHVDHDHLTGKVRGLLCIGCNLGLGGFKDNLGFLENAIKYLNKTNNENSSSTFE